MSTVGISGTKEEMEEVTKTTTIGFKNQRRLSSSGGEHWHPGGPGRVCEQVGYEGEGAPAGDQHLHEHAEGATGGRAQPRHLGRQPDRTCASLC